MAQIFADVFATANITVKICGFLCTAYILANICAKNNGKICRYFCDRKYYRKFLHKYMRKNLQKNIRQFLRCAKITKNIYGNFCRALRFSQKITGKKVRAPIWLCHMRSPDQMRNDKDLICDFLQFKEIEGKIAPYTCVCLGVVNAVPVEQEVCLGCRSVFLLPWGCFGGCIRVFTSIW